MPIKGGEVQQEKGFRKIEREDLEKNKREKIVIAEYDLKFLVFNPTLGTSGNQCLISITAHLFFIILSISCLDIQLWNSRPIVFHKLIVLVIYIMRNHYIF